MRVNTPAERTLKATNALARDPERRRAEEPLVGVVNAASGGWVMPLPERDQLIVGRSSECDVSINEATVSRRHLRLFIGDGLAIEDLGSANGSTYDGHTLEPHVRTVVELGKPIGLGSVSLFLHAARTIVAPDASPASTVAQPLPAPGEVVRDEALRRIYALLPTIAPSPLSVLVLGETGVGKEVFADAIHRSSNRGGKPFLKLNCAALPESILEGELFGYERGAFTGAVSARPGLFEAADGGTVFLDEIGELPLQTQAKLLRVLESGEVLRLGSRTPIRIDIRIISATNRNLEDAIASGAFRVDLYYRLEGVRVEIPPLRSRPSDVVALAEFFIDRLATRMSLKAPGLSISAKDMLCEYGWPGNVRELRNVVERALVMNPNVAVLDDTHLLAQAKLSSRPTHRFAADEADTGAGPPTQTRLAAAPQPSSLDALEPSSLDAIEKRAIIDALENTGGNQSAAARLLGIGRHALIGRMQSYDLNKAKKTR